MTMRARLTQLRIPVDESVLGHGWVRREARRVAAAYDSAFAGYLGESLFKLSTETALLQLRRGGMPLELATSLDHWALLRTVLAAEHDKTLGNDT